VAVIKVQISLSTMEVNEQNLAQLRDVIERFLSPNSAAIKEAEAYMKTIETQQGFTLVLLSLIQSLSSSVAPADVAVRQTAAVIFKNAVKARWAPEDDNVVPLPAADRPPIKAHLVDLMCTTPEGASLALSLRPLRRAYSHL